MSFFDSLSIFASEIEKAIAGKPEAHNLRSCKNCPYYQKGYCTQSSPPTKILSEYYAQGCIYYGGEQPVTGLLSKAEREAGYKSLLDRIKLIDEITKVLKILEITLVKKIELIDEILKIGEITTIRDLTWSPRSFIQNPLFEQGFTNWVTVGDLEIKEDPTHWNVKYVEFKPLKVQRLIQNFPIPLGVDWLSDFYIVIRSDVTATNVLLVEYRYTDQSFSIEYFQVATANLWTKKVLTPLGNVEHIIIGTLSTYNSTTGLKQIITVF